MFKTYFITGVKTFSPIRVGPKWIQRKVKSSGDAIVAFTAPKRVRASTKLPTTPTNRIHMLHFVIEHFHIPRSEAILRLRLFVANLVESLGEPFNRDGVILYYKDTQLSQSRIVATPQSSVMYFGTLIEPREKDMKIPIRNTEIPVRDYAISMMQAYQTEVEGLDFLSKPMTLYKQ